MQVHIGIKKNQHVKVIVFLNTIVCRLHVVQCIVPVLKYHILSQQNVRSGIMEVTALKLAIFHILVKNVRANATAAPTFVTI